MRRTPKKEENIELLKRVIMFMNYDMKKTLNENIDSVQNLIPEQVNNNKEEFDKNYLIVKIPKSIEKQPLVKTKEDALLATALSTASPLISGLVAGSDVISGEEKQTLIIPKTNRVTFWQDGDNPTNSFFKEWEGTKWQEYIPDEKTFNAKFPPETLRAFVTPDGKFFTTRLKRKEINDPPNVWNFLWYYDENEKPYIQNDYVKMEIPKEYLSSTTYWGKIVDWFEENWDELLWIAGAIIAGILTGGLADVVLGSVAAAEAFTMFGISMSWRALAMYVAEAGVWSTKGLINIANGNKNAGVTDLVFGFLLPAVHGIGINRWGVRISQADAVALETKLVGKTTQEVSELLTKSAAEGGLTASEKAAFKEVVTLPPKAIEDQTRAVFTEINNRLIAAGKNPISVAEKAGIIAKGSFQELGAILKKNWLGRLPTYLIHDMIFLAYFNKLCISFGLCDSPDEEFLRIMIEEYEKMPSENKLKLNENIDELLKDSNTGAEFKKLSQERGIFSFGDTSSWNPKWDTIQLKKDFNIQ